MISIPVIIGLIGLGATIAGAFKGRRARKAQAILEQAARVTDAVGGVLEGPGKPSTPKPGRK